MKKFLRRLIKIVAYLAGGLVILLAIAVGLFRLFLPRLPEYQENIKAWASAAIGMTVEFSGMDARWGLSGPEIEFYDAELLSVDDMSRFVAADEVSVGVGLMRLLIDRKFVVDRIAVRDTSIEIRQLGGGDWWIQGSPVEQLLPERRPDGGDVGDIEVVGENIDVLFLQPGDERPKRFHISHVDARREKGRLAIDAAVELPRELGGRMTVAATRLLAAPADERGWDVRVEVSDVKLAGVSAMQPADAARFDAGRGDVDLSLAIAGRQVTSATADVDLRGIAIAGLADIAVRGRLEYHRDEHGWLVAADDFRARTPAGAWPASTLRFEAGTDADGNIVMADARASYLDFSQARIVAPWLSGTQREWLSALDPSGVVRDLAVVVSDIDTDTPDYHGSLRFENLGVAAVGKRPGFRGVTGRLRADRTGGSLEIDSDSLVVTAPGILGQPLGFDEASGTVIWRRGDQRTTVLSDSIVLRNSFLDSETNVEVSVAAGGATPNIDLRSRFGIDSLAEARRYVPYMQKRPRTSRWFQEGLVSGRIPQGRVRLSGPLDKFPFGHGEGQLLVEGTVRDAVVVYQPKWPPAEVIEADIVVENTSLRSEHNHILNAGNEVVDAKLAIANFREPVLTLEADATGSLDSFRRLCLESPIAEMFGGQLERLSVEGPATASLDLSVPIRDWKSFAFTTRLQTNSGYLRFEGFDAPLTDISGVVTIERDDIGSEALVGRLLGRPVAIELRPAPVSMPGFRVVADAAGAATIDALENELGLPVGQRAGGETAYAARLYFPRGGVETPLPFTIDLATDLQGIAVDLPRPLGKPAGDAVDVAARITFPRGGDRIETEGRAGDILSWRIAFEKTDAWDLDRGVVSFGGAPVEAAAETRGLHLLGRTDYVDAQAWFDIARAPESKLGLGERIRSIDMTVDHLHGLGQHLVDHRLRVDRSSNEWLVQLEGDRVSGSVSVPYDLNSGRPIVVEAERLLLPGEEEEGDERAQVDPRSLPSISIKADQLAFGNRHLGTVEAEFRHTVDGLVAEGMTARDETFEIDGDGSWVIDESDPVGRRSSVTAKLTSTDVEKTMRRLDYDPGIRADELSMSLDLSWSGGPSEHLLETLDGNVDVRIGAGQLAEVRPGAGRVFGLMSIAALPRRLALDFRDVFGKGFGFDGIKGEFRVVDGESYTCNLSLEGPAADIGIVGRAGLVNREYEQTAVVSANFGNALPVAGAIVAGPQVAAALLIISRIFRKPLQEVSQVYYSIDGTFDDPAIDRTTAEAFAERGAALGCIETEE